MYIAPNSIDQTGAGGMLISNPNVNVNKKKICLFLLKFNV